MAMNLEAIADRVVNAEGLVAVAWNAGAYRVMKMDSAQNRHRVTLLAKAGQLVGVYDPVFRELHKQWVLDDLAFDQAGRQREKAAA